MAPDSDQRYTFVPPIPTYDEAMAASAGRRYDSPYAEPEPEQAEGQSLLPSSRHAFESPSPSPSSSRAPNPNPTGRRPRGYRPPTVETDDESNLFSSSSDSDSDSDADEREAAQVRREMQELELDESDVAGGGRSSSWGKRIGLSLSLPQWRRWRWTRRLRMPGLRRGGAGGGDGGGGGEAEGGSEEGGGGGGAAPAVNRQQAAAELLFGGRVPGLPKFGGAGMFLLVGRTLAAMIVVGFLYFIFASDIFTNMARRMGTQMFDPEDVRNHLQSSVRAESIRDHLQHFSSYAHVAGSEGDFALMEDTEMLFQRYGLENVRRDVYHVYLNYPKPDGRAVEILGADGKATWAAKMEDEAVGASVSGHPVSVFHAHSKSGDVKGPLVYANYGSREDFEKLQDIKTDGAIALVRHHPSQGDQASKVKAAELAGYAGCIIYSDPADDGFLRGTTAPKGPFLPADGVQRGSVSLKSWVIGDVLTPGWESTDNMPRMKVDQTKGLVKIPSIPLSWNDAQVLLQQLKGHGRRVPQEWEGGVPDIGEWWTGDSSSPIVRLKNEQDEVEKQPIWNVYGRINGYEQKEKKIIIGNHRDSLALGAAGPHSGTAVMLEIIRILGDLVGRGWRPLRTIEFASWDAEEYNLIGSTEYVEHNDEALKRDGFAYINLDTAVTGDTLRAAGSPVFRKALIRAMNRVSDPNFNTTLRDLWDKRTADLESLGADSDYVPFQDIVGTSSLDLRFDGEGYPAHSSYENFDWMENVGDPGYTYHVALSQVLGLMVLDLADRPILPFDMPAYADKLDRWVTDLEVWAKNKGADKPGGDSKPLSLALLREAASDASKAIHRFANFETHWEHTVLAAGGWEPAGLGRQRCEYNTRMANFETDLLDDAGIPNRTQFKHVLFGPQLWSTDPEAHFPSIRDTVLSGNWTLAQLTVDKVAGIIKLAAANLVK